MTTAQRIAALHRSLADRLEAGEFTTGDGKFVWIKFYDAQHELLVTEAAMRQQEKKA